MDEPPERIEEAAPREIAMSTIIACISIFSEILFVATVGWLFGHGIWIGLQRAYQAMVRQWR